MLNAYLRYIYEKLLFFSEESQMNQVSPCQIETEMFKIKIRLLLMSIEGKFSPTELPNVCWHVVGNEVMAWFGVLVMQYLLGCVSLQKSKSGFLNPKTDFAFL